MTNPELIAGLRAIQERYRGRGGCRVLSQGEACRCALCILDAAVALVKMAP